MPGGFTVDLSALVQAAVGVNGTISDLQNNKVSDIGGADASYGDDDLAATVSSFCAQWEIGVQNLANDAQQVANRLYLSAVNYAKAEKKVIADLQGTLQSRTGMLDPDGMSPARLAELQQVVADHPEWLGKVLWGS